jgi:hypothetical protein
VDESRLYEVGARGAAWTDADAGEARARRRRRLRWLLVASAGVNAATWTLAGLALMLGGRDWGAAFGMLALATLPLLVVPAVVEAAARVMARRRHVTRPERFPNPLALEAVRTFTSDDARSGRKSHADTQNS